MELWHTLGPLRLFPELRYFPLHEQLRKGARVADCYSTRVESLFLTMALVKRPPQPPLAVGALKLVLK